MTKRISSQAVRNVLREKGGFGPENTNDLVAKMRDEDRALAALRSFRRDRKKHGRQSGTTTKKGRK